MPLAAPSQNTEIGGSKYLVINGVIKGKWGEDGLLSFT
jgi:hypothetical protein